MTKKKPAPDAAVVPDPLPAPGAPPTPEAVYVPTQEAPFDPTKLPLPPELADGTRGVPALEGALPRPTRRRMLQLWIDHYAPLYAAVGRGDLIPHRVRVWRAKRTRKGEDVLELQADETREETPSLAMRKAFGDALLEMALGKLAPQAGDDAGEILPQMPPMVWMVPTKGVGGDEAQPPSQMAAAMMEMARKGGHIQ